jgi:hypothetical protein
MARRRPLVLVIALLLAAGAAAGAGAGAAPDGQWVSYRDAYRAMVVFEKYGKPKNFIQSHYQVAPREKGETIEGVRLALVGGATQLNLPLDAAGRAVFPYLKAAYDENAVLVLNRASGRFLLRPRVSIVPRPDGVYDVADLRTACGQALEFARQVDAAARARNCVGVRFVFARKGGEPGLRWRRGEREQAFAAQDGAAFAGDPGEALRIVDYRFGAESGQLVSAEPPLALTPLIE